MKLTPYQIERFALWAIVLILVGVVFFTQRRSGYTPQPGTPISFIDLQEYSVLSDTQKNMYKMMLESNLTPTGEVSQAVSQGSADKLQMSFYKILTNVLQQPSAMPAAPAAPAAPTEVTQMVQNGNVL